MNAILNVCRNTPRENGGTAEASTFIHGPHTFTYFGQVIECPGRRAINYYTDEQVGALQYVESEYFQLVSGFFEYEIRFDYHENVLVGRFLGQDVETMTKSRDDKWLPYELRSTHFILADNYREALETLRNIAHCEIDGNYIEIKH